VAGGARQQRGFGIVGRFGGPAGLASSMTRQRLERPSPVLPGMANSAIFPAL
jgi:hypothetical protein